MKRSRPRPDHMLALDLREMPADAWRLGDVERPVFVRGNFTGWARDLLVSLVDPELEPDRLLFALERDALPWAARFGSLEPLEEADGFAAFAAAFGAHAFVEMGAALRAFPTFNGGLPEAFAHYGCEEAVQRRAQRLVRAGCARVFQYLNEEVDRLEGIERSLGIVFSGHIPSPAHVAAAVITKGEVRRQRARLDNYRAVIRRMAEAAG